MGDLYVVVSVEASDKFEREERLSSTISTQLVQAALGDTVDIPTVHGDVELVIPEGTQTGQESSASVARELRASVAVQLVTNTLPLMS